MDRLHLLNVSIFTVDNGSFKTEFAEFYKLSMWYDSFRFCQ